MTTNPETPPAEHMRWDPDSYISSDWLMVGLAQPEEDSPVPSGVSVAMQAANPVSAALGMSLPPIRVAQTLTLDEVDGLIRQLQEAQMLLRVAQAASEA